MARKPRIDYPGAFYHVIVRGNQRATIFHDPEDHTGYLKRLERYRRRDSVILHAYVLMTNHVHLLLETGAHPLSLTMQTLQFTYSQYYNRRYNKTDHVFQRRYRDPSMVSRLAAAYAALPAMKIEAQIHRSIHPGYSS